MNVSDRKNYYEVLEISTNSTHQDIQTAFIKAKNAYSDDSAALYSLMSQEECDRILEQIEEAYSILGNTEKRKEYDLVRGFNQNNTPEGFVHEMNKKQGHVPSQSLSDLLQENNTNRNEQVQENALKEEFKYQQEHSPRRESSVSKVQAYKKFNLSYDIDNNFEQEIENCSHFNGDFLKKIREYKDVTIERMAEMTKISKTYIRNIEGEEFSKLPADVYTRGFVYQYAKCLKLNPEIVATSYIGHIRKLKNPTL